MPCCGSVLATLLCSTLKSEGDRMMRVGFIGLGNVGGKLSGSLLRNASICRFPLLRNGIDLPA